MGQDGGRARLGSPSRSAQGELAVYPRHGGIQLGLPAEAIGGDGATPGFRPERAASAKSPTKKRMPGAAAEGRFSVAY
jgi:hypothetical protein